MLLATRLCNASAMMSGSDIWTAGCGSVLVLVLNGRRDDGLMGGNWSLDWCDGGK